MGRPIAGLHHMPVQGTEKYAWIDAGVMTVLIGDSLFERPRFIHPRVSLDPMSQERFWSIIAENRPLAVNMMGSHSIRIQVRETLLNGKKITRNIQMSRRTRA
jgi:hypothetical protein